MRCLAFTLLLLAGVSLGCNPNKNPPASPTNTGVNARDQNTNAKDPVTGQDENPADLKTSAEIRRRILAEKFSTDAQNVKIMTSKGKVTLRGPVDSAAEKRRIEVIAKDVAGAENVTDELDVANAPATPLPDDKNPPRATDPTDAPQVLPPVTPPVVPPAGPPAPAPAPGTEPAVKPTVKSL